MKSVRREVTVQNEAGLHLRPAAAFVQVANRHKSCEVFVGNGEHRVNGKSIMGLVMLAAAKGSVLTIECSGDGAVDAAEELASLVDQKFGAED